MSARGSPPSSVLPEDGEPQNLAENDDGGGRNGPSAVMPGERRLVTRQLIREPRCCGSTSIASDSRRVREVRP